MKIQLKNLIVLFFLLTGFTQAADLNQLIELTDASKSWVVYEGQPIYYTSAKSHYQIDNQSVKPLSLYDPNSIISLSPTANMRLLSLLQDLDEVKNDLRYSDYFVLNEHQDLLYKISKGSGLDLKPLVSAISDNGVLALADPVRAKIYLYQAGIMVAEGQLYETEGDYSLERNIHVQWHDERCYILLERPGIDGGPADEVLFIGINADGRGQRTAILPFTYLQDFVFQNGRFFISGYSYDPEEGQMDPLIVEVSSEGKVLWTNENFGHELSMSANGDYLAALSSHESIQRFDLKLERVEHIEFQHENRAALGISINDQGHIAVIRVPVDFFVKRNTHFAQIYFPLSKRSADIQIDPRYQKLFQLHSDGKHFYIGTNYEWLEIKE
ncbi:hypothetical protein HQ531_06805 [bacterium]|nr:hypothetical protein [bacterium]